MADIKLTASQQAVVDNRGGSLLVSAAAGSGKTKVLVDRLLNRLRDPISPCNLDDFLIITYTKAAASELRVKIAQALGERIAADPSNRHLQKQMNRLYLTEISTVHAFCSNLLRSYAHHLDLSADFRVAEETESKILQEKVLAQLLEEGYRTADSDFLAMVETFGYGRDDRRLSDAVFMAYKEMRCRPDMDRWLNETVSALDISQYDDAAQTPWGAYILKEFHTFLQQQIDYLRSSIEEMAYYPNIEKGLRKTFEENILQLQTLNDCIGWDAVIQNKVESLGRAVVRKPEDAAVKDRIAKVRTRCWSELKAWQNFFYADSAAVLEDLRAVSKGAQALLQFAKTFDHAYLAEKKKRKLMDFSDLEHEAIRLLTDRYSGKPTAVAREVAAKYEEILVDEYQDSNGVQDLIFDSVSKDGKNRFMVGDVKQSIYRFRLADPSIFLKKYELFPDYQEADGNSPRKILLSENFRSRPEILSACNDVFRLVMRKRVGDLDYGEREALRPGKTFPVRDDPSVELHCLTNSMTDTGLDKTEMEAEYVAARIRNMLDEKVNITEGDAFRPVQVGDIVILMRSLSGTASVYLEALHRYGIPAVCERGGNLLDTTEVQVLVAILQILDNPHQDVPLLTALASPVFGYSPEELAVPRTKNRNLDLFDAISSDAERFHSFLSVISELREKMKWLDLQSLLQEVIEKTGILTVFASMDDGIRREKNIISFSAFVQSFSQNGMKTLSHLLWYISDLIQNGGQLPIPKTAAENSVSIMSIHSSKGLEFPVVFLCDLSRKFNLTDMQDAILVDNDLAVGCNRIDHVRFVRYPTLAKKAIIRKKTAESISEELRILYVAMTRAKDRLVMTYYSKSLLSELEKINSQLTMPLSDDLCASAKSPGHWILMAALCRTEAGEILNLVGGNDVSSVQEYPWRIQYTDLAAEILPESDEQKELNEKSEQSNLSAVSLILYDYPHWAESQIPAKITATMLKGRMQDQESASEAETLFMPKSKILRKPKFLSRSLTPAEKGIATHLFLQFADYRACADMSLISNEKERLVDRAFLTREQADSVQLQAIVDFFCSSVGQWLLQQDQIRREFKFSVLMDVSEFTSEISGEKTMLQGVVDCFVMEPDGITVFDYKTDQITGDLQAKVANYVPQLDVYSKALERIYELPVKRRYIHFFDIRKTVEI